MLDALSVSAASIISPCAMMPSHTVAVHSLEMSWETIVARLSFLEIPYQLYYQPTIQRNFVFTEEKSGFGEGERGSGSATPHRLLLTFSDQASWGQNPEARADIKFLLNFNRERIFPGGRPDKSCSGSRSVRLAGTVVSDTGFGIWNRKRQFRPVVEAFSQSEKIWRQLTRTE